MLVCYCLMYIYSLVKASFLLYNKQNSFPNLILGLMIYDQNDLEALIEEHGATMCALAYSDISYDSVQSLAARVNSKGCKFIQVPPSLTQLHSSKPVVAICATRTGTGKSQTTRAIADYLKKKASNCNCTYDMFQGLNFHSYSLCSLLILTGKEDCRSSSSNALR